MAADDAVQDQELRAEALRLPPGEPRQLGAPDGLHETEEVLDADVYEACPPGTSSSATAVDSPSEAPYTAAARPAGPAPTMNRS